MNNLDPINILEPGGRRRPDLYEDIPVPFLQVPSDEEGDSGGFPNFLKEEEKEEYNEEKEMMMTKKGGGWWGEEGEWWEGGGDGGEEKG